MRRFDPDTVLPQKRRKYSYIGFTSAFSVGWAEDFSYGRDEL